MIKSFFLRILFLGFIAPLAFLLSGSIIIPPVMLYNVISGAEKLTTFPNPAVAMLQYGIGVVGMIVGCKYLWKKMSPKS